MKRFSIEHIQMALEAAGVGLWFWDLRNDELFWSDQCKAIFGIPSDLPMNYERFLSAIHPEERAHADEAVKRSILERGDYYIELRSLWPDGTTRWVVCRGRTVCDGAGEPTSMMGVAADITYRKAAENQLRESEDRLRAALTELEATYATAPIGLSVFDRELRWARINEKHARMSRLPVSVHLGRTVRELFPEFADEMEPVMRKVLATGEPALNVEYQGEVPDAPGPVHIWRNHWHPLRSSDGKITGINAVVEEITDERAAEQALRESEERLRLAQSNTGVGLFDWDLQTQALNWSPELEALYGLPPASVRSIEDFRRRVHPEDLTAVDATRNAAIEGHQQSYQEFRITRADGEERWVLGMAKAVYDAAGKPLRVVGTNLDITERKRFELALQAANRKKDEFLAMLGHELRNPLAPIQYAAEVLSRHVPNDPTFERPIAIIRRQIEHMSRLVDDLLDVSRVVSGKITLRKEPLRLAQVVDEALEVCQQALDRRQHKVSTHVPGDIFVDGDKARLVQVVTNILSNAIKFTPPGGFVSVDATHDVDWVQLTIRDTGHGFHPEAQTRLFDLFMQENSANDRSQGGLGIGLTLATPG